MQVIVDCCQVEALQSFTEIVGKSFGNFLRRGKCSDKTNLHIRGYVWNKSQIVSSMKMQYVQTKSSDLERGKKAMIKEKGEKF